MTQSLAEVTTANGRKGSVDLDALSQAASTDWCEFKKLVFRIV
jgi:hypothetical protein